MSPQHKNECHLAGCLSRDPITRFTPTGKQVCNFLLSTRVSGKAEYHRITAWEELAQKVALQRKGDFLQIVGRLQTRSYDDRALGIKKYSTEVVAFQVVIPDKASEEEFTKTGGTAVARAILNPGPDREGTAITPEHPITDDDIPF